MRYVRVIPHIHTCTHFLNTLAGAYPFYFYQAQIRSDLRSRQKNMRANTLTFTYACTL